MPFGPIRRIAITLSLEKLPRDQTSDSDPLNRRNIWGNEFSGSLRTATHGLMGFFEKIPLLSPRPQEPSQEHDLSQVVGVVVGHQEQFVQNRDPLGIARGDPR
jgi:hypothetical protein